MPKYKYIKKDGSEGMIDAADPNTAINKAPDRAARSGVMLIQEAPVAPVAPAVVTPTPKPTPPPTTTTNDTSGNDKLFDYKRYQKELEQERANLEREKEIQRQSLIDVITNKYKANETGINNAGEIEKARTRTMNLRSGLTDSNLGDTELNKTEKLKQDAIDANNAAKADEITKQLLALDGIYYQRKQDLTTNKLNELKTAGDLREADIAARDERRKPSKEVIMALAKKGVTFDQFKLDPSYQNVSQDFTDAELQGLFITNTPAESVLEKGIIGNNYYQVTKNPDGTTKTSHIDLGFNADQYEAISTKGDTMIFAPKNWDGDTSKLKTYTVAGSSDKTLSLDEQKKEIQGALTSGKASDGTAIGNPRGADGYVDPSVYIKAFENWTGTAKDFLNYFPVSKNVNPASYNLLPAAIKPTTSRQG